MRGYYALYNDNVYELDGSNYAVDGLVSYKPNKTSLISYTQNSVDVNIHLSNMDPSTPSNKEFFEDIVNILKSKSITSITKLSNEYRMLMEYKVVRKGESTLVDSGILIKDLIMNPKLFLLGLTDENEYVSRFVLACSGVKFHREYRKHIPIGISNILKDYILYIERIQLVQLKEATLGIPISGFGRHNRKDIDPINDVRPYPYYATNVHPSLVYVNDNNAMSSENIVLVYDSATEGIIFDPIPVNGVGHNISYVNVSVDMEINDYLITADKEDIESVLIENQEEPELSEEEMTEVDMSTE